jgi:hypothetical protein
MTAEIEAAATTKPEKAGEPVVSSTNHGMLMATNALASPEKKFEVCSKRILSIGYRVATRDASISPDRLTPQPPSSAPVRRSASDTPGSP